MARAGNVRRAAPALEPVVAVAAVAGVLALAGGSGGTTLRGPLAWTSAAVLVAGALLLLVLGSGARADRWKYVEPGRRDLRIDLLRGLAICFVVVNHLPLPTLWKPLTEEGLGPFTGAEMFVVLSGVVLGQVHGDAVRRGDLWSTSVRLLRRAWTLYVVAVAVVVLAGLLTLLPGVDGSAVTTYTDTSDDTTYDLYPGAASASAGEVLRQVLLLVWGPYQFNIMGLYVVLLLAAPVVLLALQRRLVALALAASGGLYVLGALAPVRLLPSQFENAFPLLSWQLLFVLGLVAGWYRTDLLQAAARPAGRVAVATTVVVYAGLLLFTYASPYLSNRADIRLALVPDGLYWSVYGTWFGPRAELELGRLLGVVVALVALYALLSAFWVPIARVLAPFLVPLGQATLYVFVLHVLLALVVDQVPAVERSAVLGTLTHAGVLALLWLAVRRRFLFGVVPR